MPLSCNEDSSQQDPTTPASSFPAKQQVFPQKKATFKSKPNDPKVLNLSPAKKTFVVPEVAAVLSSSMQHTTQEEQGNIEGMPSS